MFYYFLAANPNAWNPWWYLMVIFAFLGIISLFHIDSYVADKHKLNKVFKWGGIAALVVALFFLWKAFQTSSGQPG